MKQFFICFFYCLLLDYSQKPPASKKITCANAGFEITGTITGYDDGTSVSFLNEQTGNS